MRPDVAVEKPTLVADSVNDIAPVASMADIEAIERLPLSARRLPASIRYVGGGRTYPAR